MQLIQLAEKIFTTSKSGELKKAFVMDSIHERLYKPDLKISEAERNSITSFVGRTIDSIVKVLN